MPQHRENAVVEKKVLRCANNGPQTASQQRAKERKTKAKQKKTRKVKEDAECTRWQFLIAHEKRVKGLNANLSLSLSSLPLMYISFAVQ